MYCMTVWVIIGGLFHTVAFGINDDAFLKIISENPLFVLDILVWFILEGIFFGVMIWLSMVIASIARHESIILPIIFGIIYGGLHGVIISEQWFSWGFFAHNYIVVGGLMTRVLSGIIAGVSTVVVVIMLVVSDLEDKRLTIKRKLDNE